MAVTNVKTVADRGLAETFTACLNIASRVDIAPEVRRSESRAVHVCQRLRALVEHGAKSQELQGKLQQLQTETLQVAGAEGLLAKHAAVSSARDTVEHILESKKTLVSKLTTANTGRTIVVEVGLQQAFHGLLQEVGYDIINIKPGCEDLSWGANFHLGPHVWDVLLDPYKQGLATHQQLHQSLEENQQETANLQQAEDR